MQRFVMRLTEVLLQIYYTECDKTLGKLWQALSEITRLFGQLLDAIVYIHSQGVIHRDLKVFIIFFSPVHFSLPSLASKYLFGW